MNNFFAKKEKEDPYEKIIPLLNEISKNFTEKNFEEQENILKKMIAEIRKINVFPIFYFNEEGIKNEIKALINREDVCVYNNHIKTYLRHGLLLLDFLFPNLHKATTYKEGTNMYDRFQDDEILKFCLRKQLESDTTLNNLRTVFFKTARFYYDTPINFSPMRAKALYECFTPKNGIIYDYSAGYGGRMLGALTSNYNFTYIATEPNKETFYYLNTLGNYIEDITKRKNSYILYNKCSEELQLKNNSIDFIFSCPPFFTKEIYSQEPNQSINKYPEYKDWLEYYVRPTIKNCFLALKESGVYGVDIMDFYYFNKKIPLIKDWCNIAKEEGFYFKDKVIIDSKVRKNSNNTECVYLFMKTKESILPNYIPQDKLNNYIQNIKKQKQIKVNQNQQKPLRITKIKYKTLQETQSPNHKKNIYIGEYNIFGELLQKYHINEKQDLPQEVFQSKSPYNNKYYRLYKNQFLIPAKISVKCPVCQIDNMYFFNQSEVARHFKISRQAVSQAKLRKSKLLNKEIIWFEKQ